MKSFLLVSAFGAILGLSSAQAESRDDLRELEVMSLGTENEEMIRGWISRVRNASDDQERFEIFTRLLGSASTPETVHPFLAAALKKIPNWEEGLANGIRDGALMMEFTPTTKTRVNGVLIQERNGNRYEMPTTYTDGAEKCRRYAFTAARVMGPDAAKMLGPALFVRQISASDHDVSYPEPGSIIIRAMAMAGVKGRPNIRSYAPQDVERNLYKDYREWWLKLAVERGWRNEILNVERMRNQSDSPPVSNELPPKQEKETDREGERKLEKDPSAVEGKAVADVAGRAEPLSKPSVPQRAIWLFGLFLVFSAGFLFWKRRVR